mmetsp:Transcript_61379/g.113964  ORF Transcript_61379/g.113964 Transcript_61379/m.113964 type:complete len:1126 (+) Transcript_61379:88-3465(+)
MEGLGITGAAATAGAGAYLVGKTAFDYNRENYFQDEEMRFTRFTTARSFANTQVNQYRDDIRGMTEMVASKMEMMHAVATLLIATAAALSCAGRIGMHGPAPPTWLCGLYTVHIFTGIMLLAASFWLGMHASLRAQCAAVSLLTRKVRLPIPSMSQLDAARAMGSQFEKMRLATDVLRVPYTAQAESVPKAEEGSSGDSDDDEKRKEREKKVLFAGAISDKAKAVVFGKPQEPRKEFASTIRNTVPTWIRDEQVIDKGEGQPGTRTSGTALPKHEAPAHFKLYAAAQMDWWPYEMNARIAMLYGVIQILGAVCYYLIGTALAELRGFWLAWSTPGLFVIAQACLLYLDVVPSKGQQLLPHLEFAGFIAPFLAAGAGTLEYRYYYSKAQVALIWILAIAALLGHLCMALRMLDLATPDSVKQQEREEKPGRAWWPSTWKVPSAFLDNLWIIAPPKKLEKGQHDLLHEMEMLARGGAGVSASTLRRRKGKKGSEKKDRSSFKATTIEHVISQVKKLERLLSWWEHDSIWPSVSEKGKKRIEELQSLFDAVKAQVPGLKPKGGDWVDTSYGEGEDPHYEPTAHSWFGRGGSLTGEHGDPVLLEGFSAHLGLLCDRLYDIEEGLHELHGTQAVSKQVDLDDLYAADEGEANPFAESGSTFLKQAPTLPGRILAAVLIAVALCWSYMIVGCVVDILIWPETLLKWPGEPPWIRDRRHRHIKSTDYVHHSIDGPLPADYGLYEAFDAKSEYHLLVTEHPGGGSEEHHDEGEEHGEEGSEDDYDGGREGEGDRRLSSSFKSHVLKSSLSDAMEDFMYVLPTLNHLARVTSERGYSDIDVVPVANTAVYADTEFVSTSATPGFMAPQLQNMQLSWPSFFEPSLLACGKADATGSPLVALTKHAFGAYATVPPTATEAAILAEPFSFAGLNADEHMVGSAWTSSGFKLIATTGEVFRCPGSGPSDGVWACERDASLQLPVERGTQILAAALSDSMVALALNNSVSSLSGTKVDLFHVLDDASTGWKPLAEVHLPAHNDGSIRRVAALSFAEDALMVLSDSGELQIRNMTSGATKLHHSPSTASAVNWRSTCALQAPSESPAEGAPKMSSSSLRLGLRRVRSSAGLQWKPEVFSC